MATYGQQLRALREAAQVQQVVLADRIGMTRHDLCEAELGNRNLNEGEFYRAKAALVDLVEERRVAWEAAKSEPLV